MRKEEPACPPSFGADPGWAALLPDATMSPTVEGGSPREVKMIPGVRVLLGLTLAVFGSGLFTLAFPPHGLWPLVFVGFVPVALSLHRVMPPRYAGFALGVGVGGFFFSYFGGMFAGVPLWSWLPVIIGVFATPIGFWEQRFNRRTGYRYLVPAGAVIWVSFEMIRGTIPFMGTWGFVSYALFEQPWLIQPVSVFSIYGLNLLIMLVNFCAAAWAVDYLDCRWRFESGVQRVDADALRRWTKGVTVALVLWVALSLALLGDMPGEVGVAAVQPVGVHTLGGLFDLSREAAERGARLIVWPEAFLPFDPGQEHTARFVELAAETDAYLVIGYAVREDAGLRNEAAVLSPGGEFLGVYGKDHPVLFAGETSLTRGTYPTYGTSIGRIGTIICYDLDFTDTARKITQDGAGIIAVPSMDPPEMAHKHYTHIIFRAVENRVSVIKADVGYDSVIVDPYGRILARSVTVEPTQAIVAAEVPVGPGNAPVVRLGDWMGWVAVLAAGSFVAWDFTGRWRRR